MFQTLTRGVLVTLPALQPMVSKKPKGLNGSINRARVDAGSPVCLHSDALGPAPLTAAVGRMMPEKKRELKKLGKEIVASRSVALRAACQKAMPQPIPPTLPSLS